MKVNNTVIVTWGPRDIISKHEIKLIFRERSDQITENLRIIKLINIMHLYNLYVVILYYSLLYCYSTTPSKTVFCNRVAD